MRQRWTDQEVRRRLVPLTEAMGRMPTASEVARLDCNALAVQVSRRGGFDAWAERLGVAKAMHASRRGWRWEEWVASACRDRGMTVETRPSVKCWWDLRVDGRYVDVKMATGRVHANRWQWTWRIGKSDERIDIYVMVAVHTEPLPPVTFIMPQEEVNATCMTARWQPDKPMGRQFGKHSPWRERWDLLGGRA